MTELSYLLIGILVGIIIGVIAHAAMQNDVQKTGNMDHAEIGDLLKTQVLYQQSQNFMRDLQLQQQRQEAEFRQLETDRLKHLAESQRLNHYDLRKALEFMGRDQC